jgi:hypothetical protein
MFKYLCKGISIIGVLFSCGVGIVHADETKRCGKDGTAACEVELTFAPAFGDMCAGGVQTKIYIIENTGPLAVEASIQVVNSADGSPNQYASIVTAPTNSCGDLLVPGSSCEIEVEITPPAGSTTIFDLELQVNLGKPTNQGTIEVPIMLTANDGCDVTVNTPLPVFTDVCFGGSIEQQTFTLTNNSDITATLSVPNIVIVSPDAFPNDVVTIDGSSTCETSLAAGTSCNIVIDVAPPATGTAGPINRLLEINVNGIVTLQEPIQLNVLGSCAVIFSSPLPTPFNMSCGDTLQLLTYIVKNNTAASVTVDVASILNPDPDPLTPFAAFFFPDNCSGTTLAPGANCTIVVALDESCDAPEGDGTFNFNRTLNVPTSDGTIDAAPITTSVTIPATAAPVAEDYLGNAASCAVLAGSAVSSTPSVGTIVTNGDVCVSSGTITGFPPAVITPPGDLEINTAVATLAQTDLSSAISTLTAIPCQTGLSGEDLGGKLLTEGVYCFNTNAELSSMTSDGILLLDGDADSVFIFQIGTTLSTESFTAVQLSADVNPNNIYWVVGTSATIGTNTQFIGNILAHGNITLTTGANLIQGRALAKGIVTLDNNDITACISATTC